MAGIFENYRCEHHPDAETRLNLAINYLKGDLDVAQVQKILKGQDRWMRLEVESSNLAGTLIEPMVNACPKKKYILTLRDPYSWCDSWLDHNINTPPKKTSLFAQLDHIRLRVEDFTPTKHDTPLTERGLPPLTCYFQLWASHNSNVLRAVPQDRLLIIKTQDIIEEIPMIARWVGVSVQSLRHDRGWLEAAPKKHAVLSELDPSYVRDTVEHNCGELMKQYFPTSSV
jgi:hypothetical protein